MNISEVNEGIEKIALPSVQKKAIVQLIDTKINNDMKEVIARIDHLETKFESRFQILDGKVQNLGNEIKVVYWVVGIAMAIILFVVAKK